MNFAYWGSKTSEPARLLDLYGFSGDTIAVDIETVSLEDRRPIGIAIATSPNDAYYFPLGNHPQEPTESPIVPWNLLEDSRLTKVFHNGAYDTKVLWEYCHRKVVNITDTMLTAQIMGIPPFLTSLFQLCNLYYGETLVQVEDLIGKKGKNQGTMEVVDTPTLVKKCCQDATYTLRLWNDFQGNFSPEALDLDLELLPIVQGIEARGMAVDRKKLLEHKEKVEHEVHYYQQLCKGMGFNPGSSLQVAAVLSSRGWPIRYSRKTKKPMLDGEMLRLNYGEDPISHIVMNYRGQRILLSTFIIPVLERFLQQDGRVYGRINLNATGTGRLSRSQPNLQNIPPSMRDIYIVAAGMILEVWDLSQIELRVLAYLVWQATGDKTMQEVFDRGGDIHQETANFIGCTRRLAKDINFALTYGGDAYTLETRANIPIQIGQAMIEAYFRKYPGVRAFIRMVHNQLHRTGHTQTVLGRQRDFRGKLSTGQPNEIAAAEREGFNLVIQGSAGEILKRLMIRAAKLPQVNTVHDELDHEVEPFMVIPRDFNQDLAPYKTPMSVKRGYNWGTLICIFCGMQDCKCLV